MNTNAALSLIAICCLALGSCATPTVQAKEATETGTRATPFLLFQGEKAEEAMDFYIGLFEDGEIVSIERYGPDGPGTEGTVYQAEFRVAGQSVRVTDSIGPHAFDFTPSWSFFVDCTSEEEVEELVAALVEGGSTMMPLGEYGWSRKFAWVQDRFGISWQINLPFAEG